MQPPVSCETYFADSNGLGIFQASGPLFERQQGDRFLDTVDATVSSPGSGYRAAMRIREAEQRDLDALGRLGAMLMQAHFAFDRHRFLEPAGDSERGYASFLGGVLDDPDGCIFVAESDEGIAGYVYVALEPLSWKELRGPAGFIHDLAVGGEWRRSGAGTMLLEAALTWLRERGSPRAILWTAASNTAAHSLFQRSGFRDTMVEMTLELPPAAAMPSS